MPEWYLDRQTRHTHMCTHAHTDTYTPTHAQTHTPTQGKNICVSMLKLVFQMLSLLTV
jgi:hypothetical protein